MAWGDPRQNCRYAVGGGTLLVGDHLVLLLSVSLDHPLVEQCWTAIADDEPWDDVADILLSAGRRIVSGFCLIDRRDDGHLVARGPIGLELTGAAATQRVEQAGTWSEQSLAGLDVVQAAAEESAEPTVPLGYGVAAAGRLSLGQPLPGRVDVRATADSSSGRVAPTAAGKATPETEDADLSVLHDDTRPELPVPAADRAPTEPALRHADPAEPAPAQPTPVQQAPIEPGRSSALRHLFEETRLPEDLQPGPPAPPASTPDPSVGLHEPGALTLPPQHTATLPPVAEPQRSTPPSSQPPPPAPAAGGFIASMPDFGVPSAPSARVQQPPTPAPSAGHPAPAYQPPTPVPPPVPGPSNSTPSYAPPGAAGPPTGPERGFGMTVSLAQLRASGAGADGPIVFASRCPRGHINPAHAGICRVCRQQIPPQSPFSTPRPPLGRLVLPGGDAVTLDRGAVLGREPAVPPDWTGEQPHLVRITNPEEDVSRRHLEIRLDMFHVLVRDLGSQNGTELVLADGERRKLRSGELVPIEPGTTIVLAETVPVRFEVTE